MSPNVPDPYASLGVTSDASDEEIKRAYRKLARENHPDSTGGDKAKEARFKEISVAYDILSDPEKRAQYDAMKSAGAGGIPPGIFDLGDLFAQVFGGTGPQSGSRVHVHTYGDTGTFDFGGFGSPFGQAEPARRAPGRQRPQRKRPRRPQTPTRIRASDGSQLVQKGRNVHSDVRIAFDQAVLGTVCEVPTIGGVAKVKIPPGTSSGAVLRLKEKGPVASGKRGDHLVTVQIDVPKSIDDETTQMLVELMSRLKKQNK